MKLTSNEALKMLEDTRKDFEKWLMPGHGSAMMSRFDLAKIKKMKELI